LRVVLIVGITIIDVVHVLVSLNVFPSLRIALNGKVITNSAEVWKCTNVELKSAVKLAMQVDLCDGLKLRYHDPSHMVQIVWAGMNDFELQFDEANLDTHPPLRTGLAQMRLKHLDGVNPEVDQFIIRTIDGKLLEERIVRLPNGYPTTDREADAFDAESAKKDAAMQNIARNMIKENPGVFAGVKQHTEPKVKDQKKLKPNELCHCGSKAKYKVSCLGSFIV
jgi:hypothetical protein